MLSKILIRKPVRFLVTGGSAALLEYVSFVTFVLFIDSYVLLLNALSFALGFAVSFMVNRMWVFESSGGVPTQLVKYAILATVNLCISSVLLWMLMYIVPELIAKLAVMVLVAAWNYTIFSRYIFHINKNQSDEDKDS